MTAGSRSCSSWTTSIAIQEPDCLDPLATIAQAIPAGSQLAVASRTEPSFPLGRMRANRVLAEVGPSELGMTTREAAEVLASCGLELRPDAVKRLVDETEGWPVGLYLAGLSLAGRGDQEGALADFHGDDRLVVDYIREVFLSGLDRDTLEFLLGTSILDRFSGEVCDAVLGRSGSAEMLHGLVRSNLLIVPLDGRDRTYRYHALLRDTLRSELVRSDAAVASALHTRASDWYRERGDVDRAVVHAIEAGDPALAGSVIWANVAEYASSGRHATVRGWLANFSDAQLATLPELCLARATLHLAEGDGTAVERWTGLALDQLEAPASTSDDDVLALDRPDHPRGRRRPRGRREHARGRHGGRRVAVRATVRGAPLCRSDRGRRAAPDVGSRRSPPGPGGGGADGRGSHAVGPVAVPRATRSARAR